MNLLTSRQKRGLTLAASALVLLTVGACSSSDEPDPNPTTPSATATTEDPAAADEAAVASTVKRYWAAYVQAQNGPSSDRAPFEGVATGSSVEAILSTARSYEEQKIRRVGAPTIGEPTVVVTDATATAEQCVDESTWAVERNGEKFDAPPEAKGASRHLALEKQEDDSWLVVGTDDDAKDTLTC